MFDRHGGRQCPFAAANATNSAVERMNVFIHSTGRPCHIGSIQPSTSIAVMRRKPLI